MRKFNYKLLSLAVLALSFTACEEGDLTASGEVEAAMGDLYVKSEAGVSQLFRNADEALRSFDFDANPSVPITVDGATFDRHPTNPDMYILDYGAGTTTRGKLIEGRMEILVTGTDYLDPGTTAGVNLRDYKEDGKAVTGTVTIESLGNSNFDLDVNEYSIYDDNPDEDGGPKRFMVNAEKTVTWLKGSETPADFSDDSYQFTGDATATYNNDDYTFVVDIVSPLVLENTCTYRMVQGAIDLQMSSTLDPNPLTFTDGTIDFLADDGCDRFFQIQLTNENGQEIKLSRQFDGF